MNDTTAGARIDPPRRVAGVDLRAALG